MSAASIAVLVVGFALVAAVAVRALCRIDQWHRPRDDNEMWEP